MNMPNQQGNLPPEASYAVSGYKFMDVVAFKKLVNNICYPNMYD